MSFFIALLLFSLEKLNLQIESVTPNFNSKCRIADRKQGVQF